MHEPKRCQNSVLIKPFTNCKSTIDKGEQIRSYIIRVFERVNGYIRLAVSRRIRFLVNNKARQKFKIIEFWSYHTYLCMCMKTLQSRLCDSNDLWFLYERTSWMLAYLYRATWKKPNFDKTWCWFRPEINIILDHALINPIWHISGDKNVNCLVLNEWTCPRGRW